MFLILYGAGGVGSETLEIAKHFNDFEEIIYAVDTKEFDSFCGLEVKSMTEIYKEFTPNEAVFSICLGEPFYRKKLWDSITEKGFMTTTLIHPDVEIPSTSYVEEGCIIYKNAYIGPHSFICKGSLIMNASIAHDCSLGAFSVVAGGACLSGNCSIGNECFIGSGAIIKEKVSIGQRSIVGMAAAVYNNISDEKVVAGNPARILKDNVNRLVFS